MAIVYTKEEDKIKMSYTHAAITTDTETRAEYVETRILGTEAELRAELAASKLEYQNVIDIYQAKIDDINEKLTALNALK